MRRDKIGLSRRYIGDELSLLISNAQTTRSMEWISDFEVYVKNSGNIDKKTKQINFMFN